MLISVGDPKGVGGDTMVDPTTVVAVGASGFVSTKSIPSNSFVYCLVGGCAVKIETNLSVRVVARRINRALGMKK